MELSYAQNLEDYHLAQIFAGQKQGFYIDIGGGHPVADNVSFWFYLQGWHGLVVEPQARLAALYPHVRPRDTVLCTLVSERVGEMDFHEVERLHGFSTTVARYAEGAGEFGASFRTERKPVTTLAALCEAHQLRTIDFLKVDVEGAEAQVLRGGDWRRWRPRVVVVEAVAPGSMTPSHAEWEPLLVSQGYHFAFFDGLNRFYVADEAAELLVRFPSEKAPWNVVRHLYEFGRAPENPEHPDHLLARALVNGFLAALPTLDRGFLRSLAARREDEAAAAAWKAAEDDPDRLGAALGRIAACYDGGQLLDN